MTRALSPVFGTLLLASITVALAAILATTVGTAALGGPVGAQGGEDLTEFTRLSAEASTDGTIILTHEAGDPIDVGEITVTVTVEGAPLAEQPPVPFFSTTGFEAGPTGPFNSAADSEWTVGERASFTIADSNDPVPDAGDEVRVEVLQNGRPLGRVSTSVSGGGG